MTEIDTPTLIEALRAAGHEDQADRLRDGELAEQLEAAGHTDLAASLKAKAEGSATREFASPASEQQQAPSQAEQDAEVVVAGLKGIGVWPDDPEAA